MLAQKNIFMKKLIILPISALLLHGAMFSQTQVTPKKTMENVKPTAKPFEYVSEQFADLRILRYEIPSFNELTLQQKELLYYSGIGLILFSIAIIIMGIIFKIFIPH